jgi:hypothetical protein
VSLEKKVNQKFGKLGFQPAAVVAKLYITPKIVKQIRVFSPIVVKNTTFPA